MNKEQNLLLATRYHLSKLGYSESEIDSQDAAILNFSKLLIDSLEMTKRIAENATETASSNPYKYYMHINNPTFSEWEHDAMMCTFERDWNDAVAARDLDTCNKIVQEVATFCKTHRVPHAVVDFLQTAPGLLATLDWTELDDWCPYIVDAYCDENADEYVDGITGK